MGHAHCLYCGQDFPPAAYLGHLPCADPTAPPPSLDSYVVARAVHPAGRSRSLRLAAATLTLTVAALIPAAANRADAATPCSTPPTHFWCGIPGGDITFHWWHFGMSLFNPHGPVTP